MSYSMVPGIFFRDRVRVSVILKMHRGNMELDLTLKLHRNVHVDLIIIL